MNSILAIGGGVLGSAIGGTISMASGLEWWQTLLIAILPTLLGFILDLIIGILHKKGIISKETKEKLEEDSSKVVEKAEETSKELLNKEENKDGDTKEN